MKLTLLPVFVLFCFAHFFSQAQQLAPCGFDKTYQQNQRAYDYANQLLLNLRSQRLTHDSILTVPVVVHIIHNGGAENISDAQIMSQLDVLNEDFGKLPGTAGFGAGVDTKVRFCLAKLTPDGRCTNGIVRIRSTLTNHLAVQRSQLSQLSFWDNQRYLNIYIVKTIDGTSGVLGYASFPGGPAFEDGIVVRYNAFGRVGALSTYSNLGRTATHEVGHWTGLYHTFNNGCGVDVCTDGDYVCDTPPAANPNFGCPINANTCSNDVPNLTDQVRNYMDYSDDACKSLFTAGQRDRMHMGFATVRQQIVSPANVTSTGCDSGFVNGPCTVIADFTSLSQTVCVGNPVRFVNRSLNGAITYQWSFPGATPATSTDLNPTVSYPAVGSYTVTLIASDSTTSDTLTLSNFITVINPPVGLALPYAEGFESPVFPPGNITISNPDNGITWERDTLAVAYEGVASARINNLINTNYGQVDALVLPGFDLTTFSGTPFLSFRWAYARSDANYSDQLVVQVSTDCGVNYAQVLSRSGNSLATGPTQTTPYLPDANTIWKTANISLANYAASANVLIRIANVTDGGNNLYIDDLRVGSSLTGIAGALPGFLEVFPNPALDGRFTVQTSQLHGQLNLRLVDVLGRVVYQQQVEPQAGQVGAAAAYAIQVQLPDGVYILQAEQQGAVYSRPLYISR